MGTKRQTPKLTGRLTIDDVDRVYKQALQSSKGQRCLDLSSVDSCDFSVIQVILSLRQSQIEINPNAIDIRLSQPLVEQMSSLGVCD